MVDRLTNLSGIFENPNLDFSNNKADGDDILGDAYEYLMRHFATAKIKQGNTRANHVAELETKVNQHLATSLRIKGVSPTNLRKIRQFYCEYPIQQSLPVESDSTALEGSNNNAIVSFLATQFALSWTHYVTLLSLDNQAERRFYEIEATQGSWSVRELERQISS